MIGQLLHLQLLAIHYSSGAGGGAASDVGDSSPTGAFSFFSGSGSGFSSFSYNNKRVLC
jgi:hypothetical protein